MSKTTQSRSKAKSTLQFDPAKAVGARLRAIRKAQKVTLVELAHASGVDSATISRIETGRMLGTLGSHLQLAHGLGMKITDLYAGLEDARTKDAVSLQRPSERTEAYHAGKWSMALLTSNVLKKKLLPTRITIEPGGSTPQEEARVGTEKFLYVLEGRLEARVGEATYELKRGNTFYLDASIPHSLRNPGSRSAKCLSVVTPPAL